MTRENNEAPHIGVNAQYIKDLSFENPNAPSSLVDKDIPQVDLYLDLNITPLPEENFFEVLLVIEAKAKNDDTVHYVLELKYAAIFHLMNIPSEQQQIVLAVHCPSMIFPFARRIIANVTQDGGFQPLMIDPIDFGALYNKKITERDN